MSLKEKRVDRVGQSMPWFWKRVTGGEGGGGGVGKGAW